MIFRPKRLFLKCSSSELDVCISFSSIFSIHQGTECENDQVLGRNDIYEGITRAKVRKVHSMISDTISQDALCGQCARCGYVSVAECV